MKTNCNSNARPVLSRPTIPTAPTEKAAADTMTFSGTTGGWQWGDPLSALPQSSKPANGAEWQWGDPLSARPEPSELAGAEPPSPAAQWQWGDPLSALPEKPSVASDWHWGDPLPSW